MLKFLDLVLLPWGTFIVTFIAGGFLQSLQVILSIFIKMDMPMPTPWQYCRIFWAGYWGSFWDVVTEHEVPVGYWRHIVPRRPTEYPWPPESEAK